MTSGTSQVSERDAGRILGRHDAGRPGPLVVVCGGIHGNEPAGLAAAQRVLATLRDERLPIDGEFVVMVGNQAALSCAPPRRFVERDLNRDWHGADVARLLASDPAADGVEDAEQRAFIDTIAELAEQTERPLVFLDLHSTSGDSAPFVCMADTLRNRKVAVSLPLPVIFGLEEAIDGTTNAYLTELGHTAIAVEGGQHDMPGTVDNHEAVIWLVLAATGMLPAHRVPGYAGHEQRLARSGAILPPLLELRHRQPVVPGDGFVMRPGFASFQPVYKGQHLADDNTGRLLAPFSGLILMPLYQEQGEDGYFVVRTMARWRLRLSTLLRTLRFERLLGLVPQLRRHPTESDRWIAPRAAGQGKLRSLLYLLGYRRCLDEGETLVFARRRPGFLGRSGSLVPP